MSVLLVNVENNEVVYDGCAWIWKNRNTHTVKGRLFLDVQTITWTINTLIHLPKQDIKER
jgi:hypothetical protein